MESSARRLLRKAFLAMNPAMVIRVQSTGKMSLDQFSLFQMDAAGADGGGARIVRDHDNRFAGVAREGTENVENFGGGSGIQIAGRFVSDDQARIGDEGACDGDTLFLAAGKLFGQMMHARAEADEFESDFDLFLASAAGKLGEQERQFDVFERGEDRNQIERLENKSDVLISPIGELRFVEARDFDALHEAFAFGGAIDAGDDVKQRAFSGTGRAHEREKFAAGDIEGNVVEGCDVDFALAINLGEISDRDDRFVVNPAD